jgi:tricorn protease-like protein
MKKVFFITGLILGVSLAVVAIGYVLSSQIEYVDLVGKTLMISEEDDTLFAINEDERIVFRYSIENWRGQTRNRWEKLFKGSLTNDDLQITPDDFVRFTAVSPFPEGVKTIIFSTSTYGLANDFSLFWMLNIGTKELRFFGEKNDGVVGNIVWSPKGTHFAYFLNTKEASGEYLTIDNIETREKIFTICREKILELLEEESEEFIPEFRTLRWQEDGQRLFFSTNTTEEGVFATWSIDLSGEDLKRED